MKNAINIRQAKRFVKFLEDNKSAVGLSDWTIRVNMKEFEKEPNTLARASPDPLEKELTIYLTKEFMKLEEYRKINVLLHELVHGRICVFNQIVDKFHDEQEELLVNDLTRGLETLYEFKL